MVVLAPLGKFIKIRAYKPRSIQRMGQHVRFGGMNVLYDSEGYEYPINDYGQIYIPLESEPADAMMIEEEKEKNTKN